MASVSAASIARLHTVLAASAFLSALLVGCFLHYHKIVKNGVAAYPDEWFPSVSATIGDWYPERNIFQILIALTSGPRFALVILQYFLHHTSDSSLPSLVFISGIVRTLSCGGWVYITSSDDHDIHDVMMILYMVCNIPWMLLGISTTPISRVTVRRRRKLVAAIFFATIVPLVYFFIQHKVHRIPGAYTRYAFFEWGLIFFDVLYDSISEREFKDANLHLILSTTMNAKITPTPAELIPTPHGHSSVPEKEPNSDLMNSESHLLNADKTMPDGVSAALNSPRVHTPASPWRKLLMFVSDVYLSYIFWSLFTALIPTLFYFSVWKLGIAGHELALLSVLSPLLLSLKAPYYYIFPALAADSREPPTLLSFVSTHHGQTVLHIASLIGLAAYPVPSPGGRLLLVATANAIAILRQIVAWAGLIAGEEDIGYQALVLGLGVMASSVTKQANRTNNPVWPFINYKANGYNKTGLVLALLAIYEYSTRHVPAPSRPARLKTSSKSSSNVFLSALPMASSLFCLSNLLSESSTLIAWSWTGYENRLPRGPVPHLHGSLTITAMAVGLFLASFHPSSSRVRSWVSSIWWWFFGATNAFLMYSYRNWTGYAGGLGLAVFLVSILPLVFETSATGTVEADGTLRVAKGYTYTFLVYCLFNLASIFTAAYAFVPGGVYLRERTDLVTMAQMACFLPAFHLPILSLGSGPATSLSSLNNRSMSYKYHTRLILALFLLLSLATTFYRLPLTPPQSFKSETRIFNTGIWTVHFGIDNEGNDSQQGMARVIKDMELDVVGLLETDLHRTAFGHRDLTRYMVEELNYNVDIGPGPNSHTWGAALLTKFPIISTKHHLLPSPHGELAPAIEAILDIHGTEVLVIVAHNGQEEDALDRELQSTALAQIMAASERPVIFLGYAVTKPWMPRPHPYGIMVDEGNVFDIDFEDNDRWCEYIFYRGLYRTSYARISRGIITDTETQIGQFVLPRHGHKVTNDTLEARYLRSRKEELPVEHWFPMEYYGDAHQGGVNGHYYHVFNTPLYYKLPEGAIV